MLIDVIEPIFFWLTAIAFIISFCMMAISHTTKRFEYWPPPSPHSWQYKTFWGLGRVASIGLLGLLVIQIQRILNTPLQSSQIIGAGLFVLGMSFTLITGVSLGIKQTKGHDLGLRTTGFYSFSRNPQYVGAFVWLIGLSLFIDSLSIQFILLLVALIYALCPFMEEPWLEKRYGEAYLNYKKKVPRFLFL